MKVERLLRRTILVLTLLSTLRPQLSTAFAQGGLPLCTDRYNGSAASVDQANALAVDGTGNAFVTGQSVGTTSGLDYVTIKYSSSVTQPPSPIPVNFQRLNAQLVLSWTNAAFGLQAAPVVTGAYTNIPGATSPHTNPFRPSRTTKISAAAMRSSSPTSSVALSR